MIWIICFAVSVICIGLAVKSLLSTSDRSLVKIVKIVLCLAGASFLLHMPTFFLRQNFLTALFADAINVMRMVSMDVSLLDEAEFIKQSIGSGILYRLYMAALGLLHFLMPLLSIMAVYSVFFLFFSNIRIWFINHFREQACLCIQHSRRQGCVSCGGHSEEGT